MLLVIPTVSTFTTIINCNGDVHNDTHISRSWLLLLQIKTFLSFMTQRTIIFLHYSYLLCVEDIHFFGHPWFQQHNLFASLCNIMQHDHTTEQKYCTNSLGMMQCIILTTNPFPTNTSHMFESRHSIWPLTNIQTHTLYLFFLTL